MTAVNGEATRVTIERLGHHGDGIAPGPVFVPRTLPGEVVEGVVDGNRMASPKIVTPSAQRVRPPCPHYNGCGGCLLQNAADDFVAEWKSGIVQNALSAYGITAPFRPILTSPPNSRRRAALSGRRTKKGTNVGFHGLKSDVITDIPQCKLLHPGLIAALPGLEEIVALGGSRKGELTLTTTLSEGGIDLSVTGGKVLDRELETALAQLAEKHDLARLTWGGETVALRRPPVQRIGRALVSPPPGAFLQATREGEEALQNAVSETLLGCKKVMDLFAGSGTFALKLAEQAEVHAVEGEAAMLAALDAGWRHGEGLHRVTTEARDLFRRPVLADEFKGFDGVAIDPPRAGADAQVAELARARVPVIAMVSCNPVTFARDANVLVQAGYAIDWVQPVDQFRWSPHVELVARFALKR